MKAGGKSRSGARAGEPAALRPMLQEAGGPVALDYFYAEIGIEEAARFLGTTKGQLYNLTSRHEIPFIRWGKRSVRFRRIDLKAWQEERITPAAGRPFP